MWTAILDFFSFLRESLAAVEPAALRLLIKAAILLVITAGIHLLCQFIFRAVKGKLLARNPHENVLTILLNARLFPRVLRLIPVIAFGALVTRVFEPTLLQKALFLGVRIAFIVICSMIFASMMNVIYMLSNWRRGLTASPQKGIFQVLSLMGYLFAAVGIVAILSGRDPTYILSGMTALSAVLMLVFKDSILGLTAGITLAGNGMVRIGDWIEVPGANADGNVIDIALTTVRVQNWDNTITTIPAYDLIAKPFKNWRGMSESGGRRIKRAIQIDLDTVSFATAEQLERWKEIDLLRDYLAAKIREIRAYNADHPTSTASIANARNLTNLGTFRAYCLAYIKANAEIHPGMTILVRQLQPTERGIPLEIYCFTADTAWERHENIQSDLFDHFLSILPEFGLSCFQTPSAAAVKHFVDTARPL